MLYIRWIHMLNFVKLNQSYLLSSFLDFQQTVINLWASIFCARIISFLIRFRSESEFRVFFLFWETLILVAGREEQYRATRRRLASGGLRREQRPTAASGSVARQWWTTGDAEVDRRSTVIRRSLYWYLYRDIIIRSAWRRTDDYNRAISGRKVARVILLYNCK